MSRKALTTIAIILAVILVAYLLLHILFPSSEPRILTPVLPFANSEPETGIDFSSPTPAPLKNFAGTPTKLKQTGWIPDWDFANGLASVAAAPERFESVSPVWYYLEGGGRVRKSAVGISELTALTKRHGIKLIPSIANFDADQLHAILSAPDKAAQHAQYLLSEVEKYGYDGIDIDYESMYLEDQPEFLELLDRLYSSLDSKGKILSVAVMPKWTDADVFRTLRQTRLAQDWYEIGTRAHELRIMTYNLTDYVSKYPGPVAPLDWMEATLRYAITQVDPAKIYLGVSLYGYDGWAGSKGSPTPYLGMFANPSMSKGQADAVTYKQVAALNGNVFGMMLDPDSKEKTLIYEEDGKRYTVYYQDLESVALRQKLAAEYGIAGVAYWRLGGEDTRIFTNI